ncbi:MAG: hypothetical protein PHP17_00475 [Candidatus Omnitrophica bacterium]|nr:hypothetical protein [Candidatus Omnitrophota bacterium]
MLPAFFFNIVKPLLNFGSFVVFFLIFGFIGVNFYLSAKSKQRKLPLGILLVSVLNISVGVVSLIVMFLLKETKSFADGFLLRAGIFLFAAANIFLGMILVKIKSYAKMVTIGFVVIFAISDVILTLTTEHSKHILGLLGFYAVIFTMYYFGLKDKYFRTNDREFSMREDAAKKKQFSSLTDFFPEDKK